MAFVLTAGSFASIEQEFTRSFRKAVESRKDPLTDQHLVLVPSAALRKYLLKSFYAAGCRSFSAVRVVSLNGLAQEILLDTLQEPFSVLDDPIYFVLALQSAANRAGLRTFQTYRTARGLLSTIRDLVDGLLTPDLLEQFLDQLNLDPELQNQIGNGKGLRDLHRVYRMFLESIETKHIINVQYAAALAAQSTHAWFSQKNICALDVYGFYDATPAQFDLIEAAIRSVQQRDGVARMYFPFAVEANAVETQAEYAQEFFDAARSMAEKLGGEIVRASNVVDRASGGVERRLFVMDDAGKIPAAHNAGETPALHIFNAGSPYEEAWVVAKKILQLVLDEGVRFDQIGVIARSLDSCRIAMQHVFDENQIPHSIPRQPLLCASPAGHFLYLLLLIRQSDLNHNLIFELLCSPLLRSRFTPAGIIRELLEILFITNSNDWHRLKPIAVPEKKLPDIFELDEKDPRVPLFRGAAGYLLELKQYIERIPLQGTLSAFTSALFDTFTVLGDPDRLEESESAPVLGLDLRLLLEKISDLPLEAEFSIHDFLEIFKDYLANTPVPIPEVKTSFVTIGDIMSLRGMSFDYVFITGLNQDVWPVRTSEDPFLPDRARTALRASTGAGPYPKRRVNGDEELLLFTLALRSANKRLYLSYQRADAEGRTRSASIYIEEAARLLPDSKIDFYPRHLEKRLTSDLLPAQHECSTLVRQFTPHGVVREFYQLPEEYVQNVIRFADMLNTMDRTIAAPIDGVLEESGDLWKILFDANLRFSYSRIREYVRCGFSFYSDRILKLQPSPFKPTQVPHDLTPMVMGRIAESVVKDAVLKLKAGANSVEDAVSSAEGKVRRKYAPYLPKVLIDHYLLQFSRAARVLLHYLKAEGYDFAFAETPGRDYKSEIILVDDPVATLRIYGIPDLLFYGPKKLIGETKWGARTTAETADYMFNKGEFQFCFYPELERQSRGLLESADFRYFRLNIFADLGSPTELEEKLRRLGSPANLETTLRIFGLAPTQRDIEENFLKLQQLGKEIVSGEFKILEDPNDYWSPCTNCGFILICRRTHSSTLLRAKKEAIVQQQEIDN